MPYKKLISMVVKLLLVSAAALSCVSCVSGHSGGYAYSLRSCRGPASMGDPGYQRWVNSSPL